MSIGLLLFHFTITSRPLLESARPWYSLLVFFGFVDNLYYVMMPLDRPINSLTWNSFRTTATTPTRVSRLFNLPRVSEFHTTNARSPTDPQSIVPLLSEALTPLQSFVLPVSYRMSMVRSLPISSLSVLARLALRLTSFRQLFQPTSCQPIPCFQRLIGVAA